uniref:Dynein light chain n=1 Tax=Rhizochromulina marina TaxID=1034831 RepID=A0A7S2STQ1_9STRA
MITPRTPSVRRLSSSARASGPGGRGPEKMAARPVIKHSSMTPDMQEMAIQCAQDAIAAKNTEQEIAMAIRQNIETMFPATWHVLVGRNFGCFVTHEASKFIYFYIGQVGVCMFATA